MIRTVSFAATCLLIGACTTMRPVHEPRDELTGQIRMDELLKPGDRIRIVTHSGAEQNLRVLEIRAGTIVGRRSAVQISEIASLEKRERSWVKTGVLLGLAGLALFGTDCEDDPACDLYGGFCCS